MAQVNILWKFQGCASSPNFDFWPVKVGLEPEKIILSIFEGLLKNIKEPDSWFDSVYGFVPSSLYHSGRFRLIG